MAPNGSHRLAVGRRVRLGLVGATVLAGLLVWSAGLASASGARGKASGGLAKGRIASGNPKVGHMGAPAAASVSGKRHRSVVTPFGAIRKYRIVSAQVSVPDGSQTGASALCPAGRVVIGGGAYTASASLGANVNSSYPLADGSAWNAYEGNTTGATDTLTAYAICAKKPLGYSIQDTTVDNPAGSQTFGTVTCPGTKKVLGVGAALQSFDTAVNLNGLIPLGQGSGFGARAWGNNASSVDDTMFVFAVCGKVKGWSMSSSTIVVNPAGTQTFVEQPCPSGRVVLGGGVLASSDSINVNLSATYPNPGSSGWGVYENNASSDYDEIFAVALCGT